MRRAFKLAPAQSEAEMESAGVRLGTNVSPLAVKRVEKRPDGGTNRSLRS